MPCQRADILVEVLRPDEVEDHVRAAAVCCVTYRIGEHGVGYVQAPRPEAVGRVRPPGGARGADAGGADRAAHLGGGHPHAACDRVDEGRIAGAQAAEADEALVCGEEHLGHGRRIGPRHADGYRHGVVGRHGEFLGIGASADEAHHAIPDVQGRRGGVRDGSHLAHGLEAEDVAGPGRWRVEPAPLQEVGPVHGRRPHRHEDLSRGGCGVVDLAEVENPGVAGLAEGDCLHAASLLRCLARHFAMGTVGVEPTPCFHERSLSPPRLPFRHVPVAGGDVGAPAGVSPPE